MIIRYNLPMKIAVLSDIHANYIALETCVNTLIKKGATHFIFLGDYLTDLAFPLKTIAIMKDIASRYPTYFIRGNREDYLLENAKCPKFRISSKSGSLYYTYREINQEVLTWFSEMPIYKKIEIDGISMELAHANVDDNHDLFFAEDIETRDIFSKMTTRLLLLGHSHQQYIKTKDDKVIVNPGCMGLSQFGHKCIECAMVETINGDFKVELLKIPYDNIKAAKEQFKDDFKDCAKVWMLCSVYSVLTGNNYHLKVLSYVQEKLKTSDSDIYDESIWQEAKEYYVMKDNLEDILKDCV